MVVSQFRACLWAKVSLSGQREFDDGWKPLRCRSGFQPLFKHEGYDGQIVPQAQYEFWIVATMPVENNGLGLDFQKAEDAIRGWISIFRLRLAERG